MGEKKLTTITRAYRYQYEQEATSEPGANINGGCGHLNQQCDTRLITQPFVFMTLIKYRYIVPFSLFWRAVFIDFFALIF